MGSTARPWVIQGKVHVKPQSDHMESASELAALSVNWPVHQVLTPWSLPVPETCVHPDLHPRDTRSTASPTGSYWARGGEESKGAVPPRTRPWARAGLSIHMCFVTEPPGYTGRWVLLLSVFRWEREAQRDLVTWLRSPLSARAGIRIYFLMSEMAS